MLTDLLARRRYRHVGFCDLVCWRWAGLVYPNHNRCAIPTDRAFVNFVLCRSAFALSTSPRPTAGRRHVLLGCAAGAPFCRSWRSLPKQPPLVGTMVLLMVVTVGYLPVVLPLLLPGVAVNPAKIAQSLVLLMLLPLGIGLALKSRYEELAARVKPMLDRISNISLIMLVLLITAANLDKVLEVFGTRGILASVLFIVIGFGIGWLLGGPGNDTRRVLALGTAQRNIAAALVVATQSFSDPRVVVMVIVVAIVGLVMLMPLSRALAKR